MAAADASKGAAWRYRNGFAQTAATVLLRYVDVPDELIQHVDDFLTRCLRARRIAPTMASHSRGAHERVHVPLVDARVENRPAWVTL